MEKLAIYDIRGIQDYIFRTNKMEEIVGASLIVDNILLREFEIAIRELIRKNIIRHDEVILDWDKKEELEFNKNSKIRIEILYYGGGNLVVLFRDEITFRVLSTQMVKNITNNAYGLSLVYASVDKGNNYNEDWKKIRMKLSEIKANTPLNKPSGIYPIVAYEKKVSRPLSYVYKDRKVSREEYQKLSIYDTVRDNDFNELVRNIMIDSRLSAIVHIDGNNMGLGIRKIMKDVETYEEAVRRLRKISCDIHDIFEVKAMNEVINNLESICKNNNIKFYNDKTLFIPIIQAGDDITFICEGSIAIDIVKTYINVIRKGYMYNHEFNFSACAGICYFRKSINFRKIYDVSKSCCKSAKMRAKNEGMVDGKVANFFDYDFYFTQNYVNFDEERELIYTNKDGNYLLNRPYGIYLENDNLSSFQKIFSLQLFEENMQKLSDISNIKIKEIKDSFYESSYEIEKYLSKISDYIDSKDLYYKNGNKNIIKIFDVLEMAYLFRKGRR